MIMIKNQYMKMKVMKIFIFVNKLYLHRCGFKLDHRKDTRDK